MEASERRAYRLRGVPTTEGMPYDTSGGAAAGPFAMIVQMATSVAGRAARDTVRGVRGPQ